MATTWVDVANIALTKLGQPAITSLEQDSPAARLINLRYQDVRDIVLRAHPWHCARKRVQLAPLVETPVFGYTQQYVMPPDCLRIVRISDNLSLTPFATFDYQIENGKILCNAAVLQMIYVSRIEDVRQLDLLLIEAIASYLAWELSFIVVQSQQLSETMFKLVENVILKKAKSVDSQENPAGQLGPSSWVESRFMYASDYRVATI